MATLIIGGVYLWTTLVLSGNWRAGIGAVIFTFAAGVLIWYPEQVAMIPVHRGMYWLRPIPPNYIRCAGWMLLLWPVVQMIAGLVTHPPALP